MRNRTVNLLSLASIQVCNALLPLLIFPFALAVVGPQRYAELVLAEALAIALLTVVLYSFEVDGVAQVVGLDPVRDRDAISGLFSTIIYLRLILFTIAGIVLTGVVALFDARLAIVVVCWLLIPLSYAIQPAWLFQGLELNAPLAACTATSRALAVGLVFTLVDAEADYLRVPLFVGGAYVGGALAVLAYARCCLGLRLVGVAGRQLRAALWSGKEIFFGNFGVLVYRDINVLVLGIVGTPAAAIASYSLAEKIAKSVQAAMRPLNQLYFPRALQLAKEAMTPDRQVFRRLLALTWPQLAVLALFLSSFLAACLFAGSELRWLREISGLQQGLLLVGVMSVASFFGVSNFMFGVAGLNAMRERGYLFRSILATAAVSLLACSVLATLFGAIGAAVAFVLAEVCLFALIVRRYFRRIEATAGSA